MSEEKPSETKFLMSEIELVKEQLLKIDKHLSEIYAALKGNDLGQEGLAAMVQRHEKWIQGQRIKEGKRLGFAAAVGAAWTLLLKFWDKVF